jgi:hypothetical protein
LALVFCERKQYQIPLEIKQSSVRQWLAPAGAMAQTLSGTVPIHFDSILFR